MHHLSPLAVDPKKSRGRIFKEAGKADGRTAFERDRDRVIHSRAWRRMGGKTQVFVAGYGDHYRDRMTHSLEVAQISRGIARTLNLNEDLAEVIALAHDLGHPPFGHGGEHALHECLVEDGLHFEHNEQSLRVVTEIEQIYPGHSGLNLSLEVLDGLRKHETSWDHPMAGSGDEMMGGKAGAVRPSLEAQIVNLADEIAYQNHDVDDGLRSDLITEEMLMKLDLWALAIQKVSEEYGEIEDARVRQARTISEMMSLMIADVVHEAEKRIEKYGIKTLDDVYNCKDPLVGFSEEFEVYNKDLKDFLMSKMYFHPKVLEITKRGQDMVKDLYDLFKKERSSEEVRDYIAGMTDHFAINEWKENFGLDY